jgi:hypothetical protein
LGAWSGSQFRFIGRNVEENGCLEEGVGFRGPPWVGDGAPLQGVLLPLLSDNGIRFIGKVQFNPPGVSSLRGQKEKNNVMYFFLGRAYPLITYMLWESKILAYFVNPRFVLKGESCKVRKLKLWFAQEDL